MDSEEDDNYKDDLDAIDAFLARRLPKGKAKYKGNFSLILFSCEEFGHIVARCPNKESRDERKSNKFKGKKDFKSYKDYKEKGKKSCYIAKDSDNDNEYEVIYITIKINHMIRIMKR